MEAAFAILKEASIAGECILLGTQTHLDTGSSITVADFEMEVPVVDSTGADIPRGVVSVDGGRFRQRVQGLQLRRDESRLSYFPER